MKLRCDILECDFVPHTNAATVAAADDASIAITDTHTIATTPSVANKLLSLLLPVLLLLLLCVCMRAAFFLRPVGWLQIVHDAGEFFFIVAP